MSSKRKRSNKRDLEAEVQFLTEALQHNGRAMSDGAKKKKWTKHDIRESIRAKNPRQTEMFDEYHKGNHLAVFGSAGTGKTFLALYLAIFDVVERFEQKNRVIIVRSAVPTREQGFLPGTLEEKQMHYENPYRDILAELFHKYSTYDDMKDSGLIEFTTTSFVRGLTWDNAIVVIDEGQNMTWHEINSIMTRIGENTRVIFTGDLVQTDLNRRTTDQTGMADFLRATQSMDRFSAIKFTTQDIVRSGMVKEWIETCERLGIS